MTAGDIGEGATDLPAKWIVSDTHFGQVHIVREAFGRPEDWEHRVRYWWKELVAPEDKVLHLGDVALEIWPPARVREVVGDLPGRITVVPGNWDGLDRLAALQGAGWTVQTRLLAAQYRGFEVFFTHAPMPPSAMRPHPRDWLKALNVHGHLHTNPAPSRFHINVSLEPMGYRPALLRELLDNRIDELEAQGDRS